MRSQIISVAAVAAMLLGAGRVGASEQASATLTWSEVSMSPATYQYTLTLDDIGSTTVGTFWYSWIPGQDYMPVSPTSISSPTNWGDSIVHSGSTDGYAIEWTANSSASYLAAGNTLAGFSYESTATPAQIDGNSTFYSNPAVNTAFVYMGAPLGDAGFKLVVSDVTVTPEPGSIAVAAVAVGMLLRRWRTIA